MCVPPCGSPSLTPLCSRHRHDRLSTRPFLSLVEKKWIVYQLLQAVVQCHSVDVCHGDIKTENVMVTSWAWITLTDFASFKPTYIPEVRGRGGEGGRVCFLFFIFLGGD